MQSPFAIRGEDEVKKFGQPRMSSLRQSFLPLVASRQEITPRTPTVTTLPSATVGELLGPEKLAAGPCAPWLSYFSCQSSLPVPASRHRRISFPSWRENTYSFSPAKAGVATPSPTVTFHFCVNSFSHVLGALKSAALPSRFCPRHCGQSCVWPVPNKEVSRRPGRSLLSAFFMF